ncbi:cathepsin L-like [Brassica rapa]|nr:cathepsin L-like [Brassica rapa]
MEEMEEEEDDDDEVYSYGGGKGYKANKQKTKKKKEKPTQPQKLVPSDDNFPTDLEEGTTQTELDWLTKRNGALRNVTDQGNRRTCWTIASTRGLSASLVIADRFDPPDANLSALHMLVGLIDKVDTTGGLQNLEHLRSFMINWGAVLEEDCDCPQLALESKKDSSKPKPVLCTNKKKAKQTRTFKVKDLIILKEVDEKELMRLVNLGPVAVTIDVHTAFSTFKGDGIYTGPTNKCRKLDRHMLLVYGYGTDKLTGIHYWRVQNSAGLTWGMNGYGKIVRQISRGTEANKSLFTSVIYPQLLDHYEGQK